MSAAKTMKLLGEVTIAAAEADATSPPSFDVTAYTGAPIELGNYDHPVVVELSGMNRGRSLVANLDHDRTKRVGTVTKYDNDGQRLQLGGLASAVTPYREEVIASARQGFVWQASIEASDNGREFIKAGKKVSVNGRELTGPIYVVRKSTLKGFAFVSHGADDETAVSIAASAASTSKEQNMDQGFKTWLEARNWSPEDLSTEQTASLQAAYDVECGKKPVRAVSGEDVLAAARAKRDRAKQISDITAEALVDYPDQIEAIEAMHRNAVENDRDPKDYHLDILRAGRPSTGLFRPVSSSKGDKINGKVVEAAVAIAGRLENLDKHFDDRTLQAAHDNFRNGIGLKQLLLLGARANGYDDRYARDYNIEAQRAAFNLTPSGAQIQAGGFSTLSIPGILSNTANKFLIEGWMAVDQTWRSIAAIRSVSDFKTVTSYSLTGAFEYDQVGAGGELKHGTVGEETYTNKADTYGKMFSISRTDIINDDLGALTMIPKRIGRGAGLKLNDIFWTEFLNNSAFFVTGNNNVSTGGGSALGIAGLTAAELAFLNQTDPNGKPLGLMPSILLVPPALKRTALGLMNSQLVVSTTTANTPLPDGNTFSGNYSVQSSPYMSNSNYTGYSTAAWYLLANPSELATIEVCFLNGKDSPTVDSADASFNVLGVEMRGYIDAGVNLQEPRAGVRSNGS